MLYLTFFTDGGSVKSIQQWEAIMTENERKIWLTSLEMLDSAARVLLNFNDEIEKEIKTSCNIQEIEKLQKLSTQFKESVAYLHKKRSVINSENPFHVVEGS